MGHPMDELVDHLQNRITELETELADLRGDSSWPSMPAIEEAWEYWNDEMCWILHNVHAALEKDHADVVFTEAHGVTQGFREVAKFLIDRHQAIKTRRPKISFPPGQIVNRAWLDEQRGPAPAGLLDDDERPAE